MTKEELRSLKALIATYRDARSQITRWTIAGTDLSKECQARWTLVNAQHSLAEFIASRDLP